MNVFVGNGLASSMARFLWIGETEQPTESGLVSEHRYSYGCLALSVSRAMQEKQKNQVKGYEIVDQRTKQLEGTRCTRSDLDPPPACDDLDHKRSQ